MAEIKSIFLRTSSGALSRFLLYIGPTQERSALIRCRKVMRVRHWIGISTTASRNIVLPVQGQISILYSKFRLYSKFSILKGDFNVQTRWPPRSRPRSLGWTLAYFYELWPTHTDIAKNNEHSTPSVLKCCFRNKPGVIVPWVPTRPSFNIPRAQ